MTREEAKKRLEVWLICGECSEDKQCYDSYLHSTCEYTDYCDEVSLTDAVKVAISALSENKGEWIEVVTERFSNGEKQMWHYECSACGTGEPPCSINKEHWDFCPNCGADMRGGE